jgi:serine/threonine protein phosphatase PrpC
LVMPHLGEYRRTHFFAVCDGHGVFGREVSDFVKQNLAHNVEQGIKSMFDLAKNQQRVVDSTEVKDSLSRSFGAVT